MSFVHIVLGGPFQPARIRGEVDVERILVFFAPCSPLVPSPWRALALSNFLANTWLTFRLTSTDHVHYNL